MTVAARCLVLSIAATLACASFASSGTTIPARTLTFNRLTSSRTRLARYYSVHHDVPRFLSDLPQWDDKDASTKDGWERELGYAFQSSKDKDVVVVTLWSLGRNGTIGGDGEDADIVEQFQFFEGMGGTLSRGLPIIFHDGTKTIWLSITDHGERVNTLTLEQIATLIRRKQERKAEKQQTGREKSRE